MSYQYRSPLDDNDYDNESPPTYYKPHKIRPTPYSRDRRHYSDNSRRYSSDAQGSLKGYRCDDDDDDSSRGYKHRAVHGGQGQSSSTVVKYSDRFKPPALPIELTSQFGALECRLCSVEVSSPIVAKMHYGGSKHAKKVNKFLEEYTLRTGILMPKLEDTSLSQQSTGSSMPNYCDICDVTLISVNDKLLHFSGQKHKKNEMDPANAKKKKKAYDTIDLSGRFGIGQGFSADNENKDVVRAPQSFVCELCDVKAVSNDQLQMHLAGKKHKEKLEKKSGSVIDVPKPERPYYCSFCDVSLETPQLFRLHIKGKRHAKAQQKLQMSQIEACTICDVTFTSYDQYEAHMNGKKHEKKCRMESNRTSGKSEKCSIECKFCPFVGNLNNHKCDESLMKIEDIDDLESKWVCYPCHSMIFDSKEELVEHEKSETHILRRLNQETGDKIVEDLKHWYCFLCKKQYRNHKDYTDHLFQEKHLHLAKSADFESKTDLFQCVVCDIVMDAKTKTGHMKDRNHLKLSLKKDALATLTDLANRDIHTTSFECSNCNEIFYDFIKYSTHVFSEEHMEVMIQKILNQ